MSPKMRSALLAIGLILVLVVVACAPTAAPTPTPTVAGKPPAVATPKAPAVATPAGVATATPTKAPTATPTKPAAVATPAGVASPAGATPAAKEAGPTPSAAELETGRTVFMQNCNSCHPNGGRGVGPDIKGTSPAVVKTTVRQGAGSMPAFSSSQISDDQLNAVAAYVSSLR